MRRGLAALTVLVALLPGCSLLGLDGEGRPAGDPVGELVVGWSEADHEPEDLRDLTDPGDGTTYLLRDGADRDDFLATLSPDLDGAPVEAVDMAEHVLVVGSFNQCVNQGQVVFDAGSSRLWFEDVVAPEDEGTMCEWSPLTVQVWQVPHDDLVGTDPDDLVPAPPEG